MRLGVEAAIVRGMFVRGDVEIDDGRVVAVGRAPVANGRIAVPGLVDLQVNGFAGVDFLNASRDDYERVGEALLATGVTAYQPTLITAAEPTIVAAMQEIPLDTAGPRVLGVHLEGPFLSPDRAGTHPLPHRRDPDVALLNRLLDAGPVTQMTLAPELPGIDPLIARLRDSGIVVAAGHTNATATEARRAFDRGVTSVTHLFNAVRPLQARDPGIVGEALVRPDVVITIIVDGHHVADETLRIVWSCAAGRVALITDAVSAARMGTGTFRLGEMEIAVDGDGVPRRADGTLAGTALTMIEAMRNLHSLGVSLEHAVGAATAVPARMLGRRDVGVLEEGVAADVVVLDDTLEIVAVVCNGRTGVVMRG